MAQCYSCRTILNRTNSSWEHILPSALGGTLKSRRLLCQSCNKKAGHLIDRALTIFCRPYITHYNTQPDRRVPDQKSRAIHHRLTMPHENDKEILVHAAILKILTNFLVWKWKTPQLAETATQAWLRPGKTSACRVNIFDISNQPSSELPYHSIQIEASAKSKTITGRVELFGVLAFETILNNQYEGPDQKANIKMPCSA